MAIVPLGVVGSASGNLVANLDITLTADIGQTTPLETAIAVVVCQVSNKTAMATVPNVASITSDAPVSQPAYECYGFVDNPTSFVAGNEILIYHDAGAGILTSTAITVTAVLALRALHAGNVITVAMADTVDHIKVTILGYTGVWVGGNPADPSGPPFNIYWGPRPFDPNPGDWGGIRVLESDSGSVAGPCFSHSTADLAPPAYTIGGVEYILYWLTEFGGDWTGTTTPTPPTSLTWLDAGVAEITSYYADGPIPMSTILGEQFVPFGSTPWEIGGCTDVPPFDYGGNSAPGFVMFGTGFWQSGHGPPYCPPTMFGIYGSTGDPGGVPGGGGVYVPGMVGVDLVHGRSAPLGG